MSTHEEMLSAFVSKVAEIQERLAELKEFADEHLGYNPDEIDWGHIGTAEGFLRDLTELTDRAYNRGEYAKEE